LGHISYFRLAGYWRPLKQDKQRHNFKPNSHFSTVVSLYCFDTELRMLLFSAIQQFEIAVHTNSAGGIRKSK
jgi:abortive infection bacteriophage resistance protein